MMKLLLRLLSYSYIYHRFWPDPVAAVVANSCCCSIFVQACFSILHLLITNLRNWRSFLESHCLKEKAYFVVWLFQSGNTVCRRFSQAPFWKAVAKFSENHGLSSLVSVSIYFFVRLKLEKVVFKPTFLPLHHQSRWYTPEWLLGSSFCFFWHRMLCKFLPDVTFLLNVNFRFGWQ